MMKNNYGELMQKIHVPDGLNDRVVSAARQAASGKKRERPAWEMAACAVLALGLVVGGAHLWLQTFEVQESGQPAGDGVMATDPSFASGITACAARMGANGSAYLHQLEAEAAARLDGTVQTLVLTFDDGKEQTGTYLLQKELLHTAVNEDGGTVFVPALSGEPGETVSGIYAVPEAESRWFAWPVEGASTVSLSAPFGAREGSDYFHSGIDIPARRGTAVTAAAAGTVKEAGFSPERGNYLSIDHGNGMTTLYAHCQEILVKDGDLVTDGETVALVGATGLATGPHLHFEVRADGEAQNPIAFFTKDIRDTLKMG